MWWGAVSYLVFAVVTAVVLWELGDRWWPATTLLFGPRWVLLLPLIGLIPGAFIFDRPLLSPILLSAMIMLGPVVGLRSGWRAMLVGEDPARDIHVASLNARGGLLLHAGPVGLMRDWGADVAAFQECGGELQDAIDHAFEWHTDVRDGLCLVSRFEIVDVTAMERDAFEAAGGSALVVSYRLNVGGDTISLTNLHLETPRAGLELIRHGQLARGIPRLEQKSSLREIELRRTRSWVDEYEEPRLVMGDFNTPHESAHYRASWGDWQNAFNLVGRGLGGTRLNGWIRARIDHILADDRWTVVNSRLGEDVGSDHLPILATVRLREGGQ